MTVAAPGAGGQFRIGDVASRAFSIAVANFPFFFVITLVMSLPNLLFLLNQPAPGELPGWSFVIALALVVVLSQIGQAVILFGAFQQLRGQPLQPGAAFERAFARFFPLLGLAILYGLAIMLGMMLLLVPGFILLVMWAVVVPVCVVEGLGPTRSMGRSRDLTKGYRWPIFGLLLILLIVSFVGNKVVALILAPTGVAGAAIGTIVWSALWAVYWDCLLIMMYHDLRVAKEGASTDQIASVFD